MSSIFCAYAHPLCGARLKMNQKTEETIKKNLKKKREKIKYELNPLIC
jgi:hypothetical protein